jgi:hypothetical protein
LRRGWLRTKGRKSESRHCDTAPDLNMSNFHLGTLI